MKKSIILLLCALLAVCVSFAMAEETAVEETAVEETAVDTTDAETAEEPIVPVFKIITEVPEGYTSDGPQYVNEVLCGQLFVPQADGKPTLALVVAYNEAASDITFNDDMPEADLQKYLEMVTIDPESNEAIPYDIEKTGLGTKVAQIHYPGGETEFYSIWHGYEVSLYAYNGDEENIEPITEEQTAVIMQFLTDMDFAKIVTEAE